MKTKLLILVTIALVFCASFLAWDHSTLVGMLEFRARQIKSFENSSWTLLSDNVKLVKQEEVLSADLKALKSDFLRYGDKYGESIRLMAKIRENGGAFDFPRPVENGSMYLLVLSVINSETDFGTDSGGDVVTAWDLKRRKFICFRNKTGFPIKSPFVLTITHRNGTYETGCLSDPKGELSQGIAKGLEASLK